ncbi:hypothetical protein P885DRAFT_61355 [Corynascus similis CBS 632.67]
MGIRVSFYLLWFFVLVGERCHEQHAQVLRGVELVLAYAVFLGLAIAASGGDLFAAEVYIALLLISTTVYLLVPRHTADLMAWIRPDLGVGAQRSGCGFIGTVRFLFVLIVIGLHLWFWGTGVESTSIDRISRDQSGCAPSVQVGFAFGPIDLHNGGFRAMNVLLMLALLAGGVAIGAMKAGLVGSKESRRRRKVNRFRIRVIKEVETFAGLTIASVLVVAIELAIRWNGISAVVNQIRTAAQLIPLGIVMALILAFLCDLRNNISEEENSSGTGSPISAKGTKTNPILEEPWIKRLRVTRSRSVKALEQLPSDHLPSPKPTIPSSTDNIPSLSSGADSKIYQKQKVTGSLRDRLVPVPEEPTHLAPVDTAAGAKSHSTKPSVAPFFRRIEAAFQDKPAIATKPRRAVASEMEPARSPSPDAEDLIQQLKEHYLQTATTLHESATMRLAQVHTDLCRQLRQTIVRSDAAFLASAEAHANKLAQPLAAVQIRSQRRGVRDGAALSWSEERSTGELVARAEEQLAQFERGVAGLWAEWAAAENEGSSY